jgi:predicted MFS family arabinose efflux permease
VITGQRSGLGVFAVGAMAGALASGIGALVTTRAVQGAGAGLVSPAALAGAVSGFRPERRGRALGVWGASAGISNVLGPLLGGLLTVALGWRADWWALVALTLVAAWAMVAHLPRITHDQPCGAERRVLNHAVLGSPFVAALTFAVMIGSFFVAEQYLLRSAGYSALGASAVLVLVALLVGAAAPLAGRLADRRGERLPATAGLFAASVGLLVLGIPGVSLHSLATIAPLVAVGLGLGMLFVPVSRAALKAISAASHGRVSAVLSIGRLLGAATGASLGGLALFGGASASAAHGALLVASAACLLAGIPACALLRPASPGGLGGAARRDDPDPVNARSTDAQALGPLAPGHPGSSVGAGR